MLQHPILRSRRPDIAFSRSGRIDIYAHVAKLLSLHRGDVVDVLCEDGEYLLFVRYRSGSYVGRHYGTVYPTSRSRGGTFRAYSAQLAHLILSKSGSDAETVRMACGAPLCRDGVTYIPIIPRFKL